jgi:hypothetical protein
VTSDHGADGRQCFTHSYRLGTDHA